MSLSIRINLLLKNKRTFCGKMFFLRSENGKILCFNLVWVFGIQFALGTKQGHRHLGLENVCLGLERFTDLRSMDYLHGPLNGLP